MALIWVSAGSPAALQGSVSPSLESQVCGAQVPRPHPLNPAPDPAEMRHQTPLHWESPQATASNSIVSGALGNVLLLSAPGMLSFPSTSLPAGKHGQPCPPDAFSTAYTQTSVLPARASCWTHLGARVTGMPLNMQSCFSRSSPGKSECQGAGQVEAPGSPPHMQPMWRLYIYI